MKSEQTYEEGNFTSDAIKLSSRLLSIHDSNMTEDEVISSAENILTQVLSCVEAKISLLAKFGNDYVITNRNGHNLSEGLSNSCIISKSSMVKNKPVSASTAADSHVETMIVSPILANNEIVGFITAVNKINGVFTGRDKDVVEHVANSVAVALRHATELENVNRERLRMAAVAAILRARQSDEPLCETWKMAIRVICDLFNPEFASVFVCDHINCEVFNVATKESENIEGLTLPFGKGFVGTVAETGRPLRTENAYNDPRFCRHVDSFTGQLTKSVLCIPIPGFQRNSRPVAVFQVINKRGGKSFSEADELALSSVCHELSLLLRWKSTELNDLRRRIKRLHVLVHQSEDLEVSILREYGASIGISNEFESSVRGRVSNLVDRGGSVGDEIMMMSGEVLSLISNHNTDPFAINDTVMIELAIQMISSYGLIEKFSIDVQELRNFLNLVRAKYRPSNAFHNFKHAWGVMHLSFMILHYGADKHLTDLDILALLLAAVCHDLDHPGNNNAFEIAIRSELAILYSDDAVLERHHLAVTHELLENPSVQLLNGLSQAQKSDLRGSVTSAILATDMSQHFKILEDIIRRSTADLACPYSQQDPAARKALIGHILHSADIGAQTQCRTVALKWTDRLVAEFSAQARREIECGVPLTPFLHGLDDELKKMQLQVGFVNGVVAPLWVALAACFPDMEPAITQLEGNKNYYAAEVERITAQRAAEAASIEVGGATVCKSAVSDDKVGDSSP
jgi:dual 3',5'-cyclic-AMP and -GMP phosphodiesterase 11